MTLTALQLQGVLVRAPATAGNKGCAVNVSVDHRAVTAKAAGGHEAPLCGRIP